MPLYSLRFRIETCLTHETDLTLEFGGYEAKFLFSKKTAEDAQVVAQVELEADSGEIAWNRTASNILPQLLDALCFATSTPLLLRDAELVLKNEAGKRKRRALFVGQRRVPSLVPLQQMQIEETQKVLARGEDFRLPLCWHRYGLDRQLAHEQFVFNWLAFEALAGDADVPNRCPTCRKELEHCGRPINHRGSNKVAAREIFQAAHRDVTDEEFNNNIWNKARNYVFHGRRYPEPRYLGQLAAYAQRLHTAIDMRIDKALMLDGGHRRHQGYENWVRRFIFFEWETSSPDLKFPSDWPATHLARMTEEEDANGPAHSAALADGVGLLDYKQYTGW